MNTDLSRQECLGYAFFIIMMAAAAYLSMGLDTETAVLLLEEGGIVETASAVGYFVCLCSLFWLGGPASLKTHWYLYILVLALGLRELDFDKRFTATGVLKSKFLFADDVGLFAKIIGGIVLVVIASALVAWIAHHAKAFWRGVIRKRSAEWSVGIALAFMVFTKSIDGLDRKLLSLGIEVSPDVTELASRFEEIFELGIPLVLLYAIHLFWNPSQVPER